MKTEVIPFSSPDISDLEISYSLKALSNNHLQNGGEFNERAEKLIKALHPGSLEVITTTSCTAALEMACHLVKIHNIERNGKENRNEVILPSFTFSSTANAVLAAGCKPVFTDISEVDFCISLEDVKKASNQNTLAVIVVNYQGSGRSLLEIRKFCDENNIFLIEDNAHAVGANLNFPNLGTVGHLAALSFHATKNITCGEGGALLINDEIFIERAFIIRDKGTNRRQFFKGIVDKYTWQSFGSSYGLSDLNAAVLTAQLERFEYINQNRALVWKEYAIELKNWAVTNNFRIPILSDINSSHIFWMIAPDDSNREKLLAHCWLNGVKSTSHYIPLHSSPMGRNFSKDDFDYTEKIARRMIRLPLGSNLKQHQISKVVNVVKEFNLITK